jgi:hypothetical protein
MIRGEATATLADGRTLTLAMGFRTLALAAAETKIPVDELFQIMDEDDGRGLLVSMAVIRAALNKHHGFINDDELDELMLNDRDVVSDAVRTATIGMSRPKEDSDDTQSPEGNARRGTSTRSKRTGRRPG